MSRQLVDAGPDYSQFVSFSGRGWTKPGQSIYFRSGYNSKILRPTGAKWVIGGFRGLLGTVGLAALIDGAFQLYQDLSLCLSPAQRTNRALLAAFFGGLAGVGGAIAFGLAAAAGAPLWLTIGASVAASTAVGAYFGWIKGKYFETYKSTFGT